MGLPGGPREGLCAGALFVRWLRVGTDSCGRGASPAATAEGAFYIATKPPAHRFPLWALIERSSWNRRLDLRKTNIQLKANVEN
jgi:hypothetical protein